MVHAHVLSVYCPCHESLSKADARHERMTMRAACVRVSPSYRYPTHRPKTPRAGLVITRRLEKKTRPIFAMPPAKRPPPPTPPQTITHAGQTVSRQLSRGAPSSKRPPPSVPQPSGGGPSLLSKLFTEIFGTALLTFTIAVAAGQGATMAPFAIGSTLMCAIYAGGHVSGANYNPAVTLSIWLRGKLPLLEAVAYMLVQMLGGFAGGLALAAVLGAELSLPFLLVGKFSLAGFPNSTPLDNLLLWLGIFVCVLGLVTYPCLCDFRMITPGWIGAPARARESAR